MFIRVTCVNAVHSNMNKKKQMCPCDFVHEMPIIYAYAYTIVYSNKNLLYNIPDPMFCMLLYSGGYIFDSHLYKSKWLKNPKYNHL